MAEGDFCATGKVGETTGLGMDSLDKKCNDLKHAYDSCFNSWFNEAFLKGKSKDHSPCEAMLQAYADCVKEAMTVRGMDPASYAKHWEDVAKKEAEKDGENKKRQEETK